MEQRYFKKNFTNTIYRRIITKVTSFYRRLMSMSQLSFDYNIPPINGVTEFDRRVLALTLYGEARGESHQGRWFVAWTIRNRVTDRRWWGDTKFHDTYDAMLPEIEPHSFAAVCLRKWQFSCWNPNDPNHETLWKLLTDDTMYLAHKDKPALADCIGIANRIDGGFDSNPVEGATHYYNPQVVTPRWASAENMQYVTDYGNHKFYKEL